VIPGLPRAAARVLPGDLVTRINGSPSPNGTCAATNSFVAAAPEIMFTFLNGTQKTTSC